MSEYIFWVDHKELGTMNITIRADSRELAMEFADTCPDFRKWEYRGLVVMHY
jgi:hypothetical protein